MQIWYIWYDADRMAEMMGMNGGNIQQSSVYFLLKGCIMIEINMLSEKNNEMNQQNSGFTYV